MEKNVRWPTCQLLSWATLVVLPFLFAPTPAYAEGFVSPFAGIVFGNQPVEGDVAVGVSAGHMAAGAIGFELDLGYEPDIFGESIDNYAVTVMGNLIIGIPVGGTSGAGVRPYVTGGIGLIRTDFGGLLDSEGPTTNDLGFNLGGGVMAIFSDHFGVRGDLRYLRLGLSI